MLMYEGMVTAFHSTQSAEQLRCPGCGVCLLLLTAAAGFGVFSQDLEEAVSRDVRRLQWSYHRWAQSAAGQPGLAGGGRFAG